MSDLEPPAGADTKECPYCAETIKARAIKCRYCGREWRQVKDLFHAPRPPAPGRARPATGCEPPS